MCTCGCSFSYSATMEVIHLSAPGASLWAQYPVGHGACVSAIGRRTAAVAPAGREARADNCHQRGCDREAGAVPGSRSCTGPAGRRRSVAAGHAAALCCPGEFLVNAGHIAPWELRSTRAHRKLQSRGCGCKVRGGAPRLQVQCSIAPGTGDVNGISGRHPPAEDLIANRLDHQRDAAIFTSLPRSGGPCRRLRPLEQQSGEPAVPVGNPAMSDWRRGVCGGPTWRLSSGR